ncbi:MAG: hypothetical protein JSU05_16215, partial [Bacteroidetes bacterium]|nr:hypothetical protein [Bacteroidota bacterium]
GPSAPRFLHFEDALKNRGTLEARLTNSGEWYLDAFLKNGETNKGLALIDSSLLHKSDQWYWVALTYDGKKMFSYVNGQKELEGDFDFPPMVNGQTSIGVRLNKVSWFRGEISDFCFYPFPLNENDLHK